MTERQKPTTEEVAAAQAAAEKAAAEAELAEIAAAKTRRIDLLRGLATEWEEHNHHHLRPALIERWRETEGLKVRNKGDVTHVTLARIKAESTAGLPMALSNWAMAARRELLELEAA